MIAINKITDACIEQGLFNQEILVSNKMQSRRERKELLHCLAFSVRMPISAFYQAYATTHGITFCSMQDLNPDMQALRLIPRTLLDRRPMLPVHWKGGVVPPSVRLVMSDPEHYLSYEQAQKSLGKSCEICISEPKELDYAISQARAELGMASEAGDSYDPINELHDIIEQAYLCRSSDIHVQPLQDRVQIRLRIDGALHDHYRSFSPEQGLGLMIRIKVISGMDISEQRMAQDGNASYEINEDIGVDLRVATMPTRFGERATLRLLGSDTEALSLSQIGMSENDLEQFQQAISQPHGMILITGPTGSGKSTSLYSALKYIASADINIMTVEDPVEYVMAGISQVQVSNKVSFSDALRAFLRHDPDVIMLGEIRDGETANTAMKAAMTGHLVFSTLHTNSSFAAVSRLRDLGAEPYLIGATLLAVISQRLVKRLCNHCKIQRQADQTEISLLAAEDNLMLFDPNGCPHCRNTGYLGRMALFETLWIDKKLSSLISQDVSEATLKENTDGYNSLSDDGIRKVIQGITTIDEIKKLALVSQQNPFNNGERESA
jgi:type II secretory ATPase GspE/PulE/Tfp pilus assembly ATPase PilB-like protein